MFLTEILLLILGFVLVVKGAQWLVDASVYLANRYKISDVGLGLSLLALGTSAPEMVVNGISSWHNHSELVFSNILGSNILNIYLVLGFLGIIAPMLVHERTVWKEMPFSMLAIIVMFILINDRMFMGAEENFLSRFDAVILLILFAIFIYSVFRSLTGLDSVIDTKGKKISKWLFLFYLVGGLTGLFFGGQLVVSKAVFFAEYFAVSKKMIGILILAPGTALPELATSLMAARKKRLDMAVGNIIGSNIFNLLLVLPISALMNPLHYEYALNFDVYFMFFGILLLFISMFTGGTKKLDRWEAAVFLCFLIAYFFFLFSRK